jgi:hypothetical protein
MSAASRIPANSTEKGTTNIWCLKAFQLDSFFLEVLGVEAELRGHTADLRVSSITDEKTWPELGFQACERARVREERWRWLRSPRVSGSGGRRYIGRQGRWRGSWRRRLAGARQRAACSEWRKTMDSPLVGPACRSDTKTVSRPSPGWAD